MSLTLPVEIDTERAERIAGELLVAPFFAGDRPLRGAAGRVDWRLCGLLARLLAQGETADAILVPSAGRLRVPRVLLLDLGPRSGFAAPRLQAVAQEAARRAAGLRAGRVALALPGELAADEAALAAVEGVAAGLAAQPFPMRLRLVVAPAEEGPVLEALRARSGQPLAGGVALRLEMPVAETRPRPLAPSGIAPARPAPARKSPTTP